MTNPPRSGRRPCTSRSRPGRGVRAVLRGIVLLLVMAWAVGLPVDGRGVESRPERSAADRGALAQRLRRTYAGERAGWPPPMVEPGIEWQELGLLPVVVHPDTNPLGTAKVLLGRTLFFDARLSASGKLACVSCHEPSLGWADGRATSRSPGSSPPRRSADRNTPTVRNVAFQRWLFWDGRATSLEQQAEDALTNPLEMAASRERVVGLLSRSAGYRQLFADAFPDRPIDFSAVVDAIACFERTIVGGRSRFDAFLRGDATALSDAALIGLDLFRREARCMNCHHGPTFSDGRFHDLGLSYYGRHHEDLGRYAVTEHPGDAGRFRTPSLRDVTQTAPLMHNGMFELPGVLKMYNGGMVTLRRYAFQRDDPLFPVKSPLLAPLGLNRQDLADLAAFLEALEEPRQRVRVPPLPEIDGASDP